jgi:ABC-type cobalamin transport system permease subunit
MAGLLTDPLAVGEAALAAGDWTGAREAFEAALASGRERFVPLDRPIPVGVITALFGTPLFIWLVVTMRRSVTA